jgi:uncharacterized RDD family membrane protein YckC
MSQLFPLCFHGRPPRDEARTDGAGSAGTLGDVGQTTEPVVARASIGRRFGALLIDWILCVLIAGAFSNATRSPWLAPSILVLEYGFFVGFFTQTPGMWFTKVRCVSYPEGGSIGAPRALLRAILLALFIPPLIMDAQGRGLHDKAARSIMVPTAATTPGK